MAGSIEWVREMVIGHLMFPGASGILQQLVTPGPEPGVHVGGMKIFIKLSGNCA